MSEHQFVHFLAIDRALNDEELDFMGQQSSRAEISRWEFTNEYHYGDFHGNAREMLRRGYDVHPELEDLREALGPEAGAARARAVAEKLRRANPRLHRLIGALRKHGLLD